MTRRIQVITLRLPDTQIHVRFDLCFCFPLHVLSHRLTVKLSDETGIPGPASRSGQWSLEVGEPNETIINPNPNVIFPYTHTGIQMDSESSQLGLLGLWQDQNIYPQQPQSLSFTPKAKVPTAPSSSHSHSQYENNSMPMLPPSRTFGMRATPEYNRHRLQYQQNASDALAYRKFHLQPGHRDFADRTDNANSAVTSDLSGAGTFSDISRYTPYTGSSVTGSGFTGSDAFPMTGPSYSGTSAIVSMIEQPREGRYDYEAQVNAASISVEHTAPGGEGPEASITQVAGAEQANERERYRKRESCL